MTCTETYGGNCPNCGYRKIFLRYGSNGIFHFDACPRCGFAYGSDIGQQEMVGEQLWTIIILLHKEELKQRKFSISRKGLFQLTETWNQSEAESFNVFEYSPHDLRLIMKGIAPNSRKPFIFR
jgi:hypothetical protein